MDTSKLCFGCFSEHDGVGPCPHCGFDLSKYRHPFVALPVGTILNGRGTANKEAESFFHIAIQPEKEVVMILVDKEIKDAVLHALYQKAGLDTMGQGIAFSLPVDEVVGLTPWKAVDKDGKTLKMQAV